MAREPLDLVELKRLLESRKVRQRRINRWYMLVVHGVMFVALWVGIILTVLSSPGMRGLAQPDASKLVMILMFLFIGWGTGLLFHVMSVLNELGILERANSRLLLTKALSDQVLTEQEQATRQKPKHRDSETIPARALADDETPFTELNTQTAHRLDKQTK